MDRKQWLLSCLNCRFYNPASNVKNPFKLRWEENRMFSFEKLIVRVDILDFHYMENGYLNLLFHPMEI